MSFSFIPSSFPLSFISFIRSHQLSQSFQLMPGNRNEEGRKNFCSIFHFVPLSLSLLTSSSFLTSSSSFHHLVVLFYSILSLHHHSHCPIHSKTSANYNFSFITWKSEIKGREHCCEKSMKEHLSKWPHKTIGSNTRLPEWQWSVLMIKCNCNNRINRQLPWNMARKFGQILKCFGTVWQRSLFYVLRLRELPSSSLFTAHFYRWNYKNVVFNLLGFEI